MTRERLQRAERLIGLIAQHQPKAMSRAPVINPATGEAFASFGYSDAAHLDMVVDAAVRASRKAVLVPLAIRREQLILVADIIEREETGLAALLVLEQGKPFPEALAEVQAAAGLVRYYAGIHADRLDSLFTDEATSHRRIYRPLGVVAGIVPWNFPFLIALMKLAPAVLTGNAIIIKPSPTTPLTALALAALLADVLPAGLVQAVGDNGAVGPMLTRHPRIAKIVFTGSTATGRAVMGAAAEHLTRVTLELGGNDAAIVLADADIEASAAGIFRAAFTNAGQICGAVKRVYVAAEIFDAFAAALGEHVAGIELGDGLGSKATMGPVQNERQYRQAMDLHAAASRDGRVVAQAKAPDSGYFVPASLFAGLTDAHGLVSEEQFSPLLPLLRFADPHDAVSRANSGTYALTASVWSRDTGRAEALAAGLESALICVNAHNHCPPGVGLQMAKQSGIGWLLGDEGLKEYLQSSVLVRAA